MTRESNRGGGRGTGSRSVGSISPTFRETGAARLPLNETAKVHRIADVARENAQAHYEKHRDTWVSRQYGRLLAKSAPTLTLHPPGVTVDPKAVLMARARKEVAFRQAQRLVKIDRARKGMLSGKPMRSTRSVEWGDKITQSPKQDKTQTRDRETERVLSRTLNARVAVAQDRARRKAEAHLVKHQEKWTATRYNRLASAFQLSKGSLPEKETQHVRDAAMDAANRGVTAKHEARLQRIDVACDRMRTNGVVRQSRPVGRNIGLGE
jgi:hypothetical protein